MPKKAGIVFIATGAVLIISALLLFFANQRESDTAGKQAATMLVQVQSIISQRAETTTEQTEQDPTEPTAEPTEQQKLPEMPVVEVGGYGYIGYLSIPELELELPVMAEWDYERLKLSPCRQFGSTVTDDLVIAAHNYVTHFARLYTLKEGAVICFTDMNGERHSYTVAKIERLAPTEVETVQNSGYALVLYTCTYGGDDRVVVFCNRTDPIAERME